MKQVKVTEIYPPDPRIISRTMRKYYRIPAPGSSYKFYFKNKKDAKKFAAGYSRHLTGILHEVNYIVAETYNDYRRLWFYLDENNVSVLFRDIDERLVHLVRDTTSLHFQFSNFRNIFGWLHSILDQLMATATVKLRYNDKYHLKTLSKMLDLIESNLDAYGKASPFRMDNDFKKLW